MKLLREANVGAPDSEQPRDRMRSIARAVDVVTAALTGLGETGWELRTDEPVGGPIDRKDEILRHYEAGCFIYSGTGWTADGKRLYYIAGRS